MSALRFPVELMIILKAINYHFKETYDKQNLTVVFFHMKFMRLAEGSFFYVFIYFVVSIFDLDLLAFAYSEHVCYVYF